MKTLSDSDYKILKHIASLSQPALKRLMERFLLKNYKQVIIDDDFIFAVGNIPIALVAHLDTVFPTPPEKFLYDKEQGIMWSPQGAGFDDRAGVFLILKLIKVGYRPHIIFTTDEEIGGMGAQSLISHYEAAPADIKYIIQLDRCGQNDCVFYDCLNHSFTTYVESFGFEQALGSFSDISFICPAWGVAGVNLSVGYENEHSYFEVLYTNALLNTYQKVMKMLNAHKKASYFKYSSYKDFYQKYYGHSSCVQCDCCGKIFLDYEIFNVQGLDGKDKFYCPTCIIDNVEWCEFCGKAFEIDKENPGERKCPNCKNKLKK